MASFEIAVQLLKAVERLNPENFHPPEPPSEDEKIGSLFIADFHPPDSSSNPSPAGSSPNSMNPSAEETENSPSDDPEGEKSKKRKRHSERCMACGADSKFQFENISLVAETPEWRKGPNGPRTLCNACGLQYAKQQRKKKQESSQS
jgi:hypothetical protein